MEEEKIIWESGDENIESDEGEEFSETVSIPIYMSFMTD